MTGSARPTPSRDSVIRACFDALLAVLLLAPVVVALNGWG